MKNPRLSTTEGAGSGRQPPRPRPSRPPSRMASLDDIGGSLRGTSLDFSAPASKSPVQSGSLRGTSLDFSAPASEETPGQSIREGAPALVEPTPHVYLNLAVFGMLGCLFRIVIESSNDNSTIDSIPNNMIGSYILGALSVKAAVNKHKLALFPASWDAFNDGSPLILGLRTGFCGALTTFSGWNQQIVELVYAGQAKRAVLGVLLGLLLCVASFELGTHVPIFVQQSRKRLDGSPLVEAQKRRFSASIVAVLLFATTTLLLAISALVTPKTIVDIGMKSLQGDEDAEFIVQRAGLSVLLAPFGVILRHKLGRNLNPNSGQAGHQHGVIFRGTFAANLLACACVSVLSALAFSSSVESSNVDQETRRLIFTRPKRNYTLLELIVGSVVIGFCASLSTASTFAREVHSLLKASHFRESQRPMPHRLARSKSSKPKETSSLKKSKCGNITAPCSS